MGEDERLLTLAGAMKACIDGHTCTTTCMGERVIMDFDYSKSNLFNLQGAETIDLNSLHLRGTWKIVRVNQRKPWTCQECGSKMLITDMDFMKCPDCETEVWFKESESKATARIAEQAAGLCEDPVIIPINHSGGSKNGRNSRKQLLKKKTCKELYKNLCE